MRDFDAFLKEVEGKSHKYKLFGIEGVLPPTIPVGLVLHFALLQEREDTEEVGKDEILGMLYSLYGKSVVDRWVKEPTFDITLMQEMIKWALECYDLTKEPEETPKVKAKAKVSRLE